MSDKIGSVVATIGADASNFIREVKKAGDAGEKFGFNLGGVAKALGLFTGATVTAGVGLAAYLTKSSLDEIDNQAKLARAIGSSVSSLQSLSYAADLAGVNQSILSASTGALNVKLGKAIELGGKNAAIFSDLGLSVSALANMDADDRLAAIADQIKKLEMDSTTAGIALKDMGLKGNEMRQFMMDGGDQIRLAKKELISFGVAVSDIEAGKIEAANDSFTRLKLVLTGVSNQMAVALAPYIEEISKRLADAAKDSGGFRDKIKSAIETAVKFVGQLLDGFQKVRLYIMEASLAWDSFDTLLVRGDGHIASFIKKIDALGGKPVKFQYLDDLESKAKSANDRLAETAKKIDDLRKQKPASETLNDLLTSISNNSAASAGAVIDDRAKSKSLGSGVTKQDVEDNSKLEDLKKKNDSMINGLSAETASIARELGVRKQLSDQFRASQIDDDATDFSKKMADIDGQHKILLINESARYSEQLAIIDERRIADLERVAGDREAMAALNYEYDQQEILAEQLKQQAITDSETQSQDARRRLREQEKRNAVSMAMGLGSQLMGVLQGHSKSGFEFSKKVAIASAGVDGIRSSISAWRSGMETGGPWAPLIAAGYAASSLLRTGAMIQGLQGQNFNSGASSGGSFGGASSAPQVSTPQAGFSGPTSAMRVEGLDVGSLFSGGMVESIAKRLLQYQKDGGQVVWGGV